MTYCLHPSCRHPHNPSGANFCQACGAKLQPLLGRYRATGALGQGSFGRTFVAIDEARPSQPQCVIKQFFPSDRHSAAEALRLFRQEAQQLERLGKHPQIPELLANFEQEHCHYIVEEFVLGATLEQELLSRNHCFTEGEIRTLLQDLLPVLQFIHTRGVIHRDIKPDNIVHRTGLNANELAQMGKYVAIDFGAAKYVATKTALAKTGTTIGTPHFDAPEQTVGQATFASDIYGLASTCLYLMTRRSPNFALYSHAEGSWIWRSYVPSHAISSDLARILDKMLCRDLKYRYHTAAEVYRDLEHLSPTTNQRSHSSSKSSTPTTSSQPYFVHFQPTSNKGKAANGTPTPPAQPSPQPSLQPNPLPRSVLLKTPPVSKSNHKSKLNLPVIREELSPHVWLDLVPIPTGEFLMGSPPSENGHCMRESPLHLVRINSFYMSKFPITQAQWQAVALLPAVYREIDIAPSYFQGEQLPVEHVSWYDAIEFCCRLSQKTRRLYRLPSEAEWEYACRANTTTAFYFGHHLSPELASYSNDCSYRTGGQQQCLRQTSEVGLFPANGFGLYDMHGNVWEWCQDEWHDNYHSAPGDGRAWEKGETNSRILRGGSWCYNPSLPNGCRSAYRHFDSASIKRSTYGFRIVLASI